MLLKATSLGFRGLGFRVLQALFSIRLAKVPFGPGLLQPASSSALYPRAPMQFLFGSVLVFG